MTEKPLRILVTTARWEGALCCVQSLGRLGHEVHVIDHDATAPLLRSRYCAGYVESPPENDPGYASCLIGALERGRYDVLIPVSDDAVNAVAARWEDVNRLAAVALAGLPQLHLAADKAKTMQFALERGYLVPKSYFPRNEEEVRALAREIAYPCVAKLPRSYGSKGVAIVHTPEELLDFFRINNRKDNWPFVQEFVDGDFYDVTAVCDQGHVAGVFAFRILMDSFTGGTPPYSYSVQDSVLLDEARRFLAEVEWHGPADLDFIHAKDGRNYLLEINPRMSGTVNFAYKLGIDLPQLAVEAALGRAVPRLEACYPDNFFFRSIYPMEFDWWRQRPRERLGSVLRKPLFAKVGTNIYWDDFPLCGAQIREAMTRLRAK